MNSVGRSFNEVSDYVRILRGLSETIKLGCCLRWPQIVDIFKAPMLEDPVNLHSRVSQYTPSLFPLLVTIWELIKIIFQQDVGHVAGSSPPGGHTCFSCVEVRNMMSFFPQPHPL